MPIITLIDPKEETVRMVLIRVECPCCHGWGTYEGQCCPECYGEGVVAKWVPSGGTEMSLSLAILIMVACLISYAAGRMSRD